MNGYIYKITNTLNNKIYVGQTVNPYARWKKHLSTARTNYKYNSYFYNAINKYGEDKFKFEVIETCDAMDMDEREFYWIEELKSLYPNGYNLTPGGVIMFGEHNPFYGKTHSDETKKIISYKNKGRKASEEEIYLRKIINTGERNPFYGKKHSKETIDKIVSKNKASGTYKRLSERMKKNNPNADGKYAKKTPVNMLDLEGNILMTFKSTSEAGRYVKEQGLTNAKYPGNSITDTCKGRQKSAFGYIWSYVKEGVSTSENISNDMNE